MFERASRLKLRIETVKGSLSVEDMWDLPLSSNRGANLNDIAKGLNRTLKAAGEEDFVDRTAKADPVIQLWFEIIKHIISVRLAENEEARAKADKKEKKERLLEIIARKQDEQLESTSMDDLLKMVEAL